MRVTGYRTRVLLVQGLILAAFLGSWEYLPQIEYLSSRSHLLDPYFISSPSRIASRVIDLFTGRNRSVLIWPYMWITLSASLLGLSSGMLSGAFLGLILSNSRFWSAVFEPFIVAMNAVPRIALIPVLVILLGVSLATSVAIAFLVVFFIAFFNAYEGGRTVPLHLVQNATIMGATNWQIMRRIRLPYVTAWTLASLPLATTFALISVITGEILTGYAGLGRLLSVATASADSDLTFAVVLVLSVLGLVIVLVSEQFKRRLLHWWGGI